MSEHDLPESFDDQQLEAWLDQADPVVDSKFVDSKLDAAATRLRNFWEQNVATEPETVSLLQDESQKSEQSWVVALALVAGLMIICGAGLWWIVNRNLAPTLAPALVDSKVDAGDVHDASIETVADVRASKTTKRRERKVVEILSVQHLLQELSQRKPNQKFPGLQLNERALKGELGQWLEDWSRASPELREKYIVQWNKNRVYWLPWAKQWCGSWNDPALNVTAIEVIAADEKDVGVPFLCSQLSNPKLRKAAWTQACRWATREQLSQMGPWAVDCEEVQLLASALIGDASPQATGMLCQLVVDPKCRAAILKLKSDWPEQHVINSWAELTGGSEERQAAAAVLLALIPSSQVDRLLVEQFDSGQHQLAALSVLLLRDNKAARRFLTQGQPRSGFGMRSVSNQAVMANLPSAKQQLVRWSAQMGSVSFLSPKVCELCSVSS